MLKISRQKSDLSVEEWTGLCLKVQDLEDGRFIANWTKSYLNDEVLKSQILAAFKEEKLIGVCSYRVSQTEAHVFTILVDPMFRRLGIARQLMSDLVQTFCCVVEVHEENLAAIGFYRSLGFRQIGRRKDYYGKDAAALVMKTPDVQSREA